MKRPDLARLLPPGFPLRWELTFYVCGALAATGWSTQFLLRLARARRALYETAGGVQTLRPDAVMPPFPALSHSAFLLFPVLALCILACAALHYASYYQNGRSIYTMRRLPRRSELHLRCWALPLLAVLGTLLLLALLRLCYLALYMAVTPDACLLPGQWNTYWEV